MEVGMSFQMCNALTIVNATASDYTVHIIAFLYQEFTQKTSVLSCNTCYKCYFSIFHKYTSNFILKRVLSFALLTTCR